MSTKRIMAMVIRHLYMWPRSLERLMGSFGWPILEITIWGLTMNYFQKNLFNNISILSIILGSLIMWQIIARTQTETSVIFLDEIWNKNLINIFSSPFTPTKIFFFFIIF